MRKVLVPVDGSKTSLNALRFACDVCKAEKSELILVHVICDVSPLMEKLSDEFGQKILDNAEKIAKKSKVKLSRRIVHGIAHEQIVKLADKENVFAIVMGTHGQTGLPKMLLGSVADRVLRNAKCPVILIPKKGDKDY